MVNFRSLQKGEVLFQCADIFLQYMVKLCLNRIIVIQRSQGASGRLRARRRLNTRPERRVGTFCSAKRTSNLIVSVNHHCHKSKRQEYKLTRPWLPGGLWSNCEDEKLKPSQYPQVHRRSNATAWYRAEASWLP